MNNKEKYAALCENAYIPIYSKPWWLDAVCGNSRWDVWLYEKNGNILAAMPYYIEQRGKYQYITKPKLTQNNGIIFNYPSGISYIKKQKFEEEIINAACEYISSLKMDVYEQQYHYNFNNWLPFFWNNYTAITRYTYVIDGTQHIEDIWNNISSKYRGKIKKGNRAALLKSGLDPKEFYKEHEKIYMRQNLACPFDLSLWENLYSQCKLHASGENYYMVNEDHNICSLLFLVWDEKSYYQILGGNIPSFQTLDSYGTLIWECIKMAAEHKCAYDFEGSVIKNIAKSFREFGGIPKPYFRIRKIFNPQIIRTEAEKQITNTLV